MFKNLVFDFDGTIVDSGETIYTDVITSLNIKAPPFSELRKYPAHKLMNSGEFNIKKMDIPKLIMRVRSDYKKYLPILPLIEGMGETLHDLRGQGARLFLCTSNSAENVNAFLKIHNLEEAFETIVGTMSIFGKSYGITRTIKKYKLLPHESIYIGDETRDIQAAKKAGIRCASVSWGFNDRALLEEYKPDFIFDRAMDLMKLVTPQ
jgi:phosphoglycolate phosphatase-like HAD superfamily hydrolase